VNRCTPVKEQGFTLIEILLVIVIVAVLSAMVAPSFFQVTGANVSDEARYMQKLLRLAAEETQLTGTPVRCSVYKDHLKFETPNGEGEWKLLAGSLFQAQSPQAPVIVQGAHLHGDVGLSEEHLRDGEEAPLARFVFWPDGRVSTGELTLGIEGEGDAGTRVIELRSGPGGIYVVKVVP